MVACPGDKDGEAVWQRWQSAVPCYSPEHTRLYDVHCACNDALSFAQQAKDVDRAQQDEGLDVERMLREHRKGVQAFTSTYEVLKITQIRLTDLLSQLVELKQDLAEWKAIPVNIAHAIVGLASRPVEDRS